MACQRSDEERYARLVPAARIVAGPPAIAHRPARLAWEQSGLPLVAQQVSADVIHSPHYSMPLRPGAPIVVTMHDLTFFTEPDAHSQVTATFYKAAIRTSARRATRLIVPSKATRDELVRVLGADPTRIDVAYHGVDHAMFHQPDEAKVRQVSDRLGLHGKPYIAYLGTLEPRKNVPALINGWVDGRGGPQRAARPGAGRRQRLERRGGRGGGRTCPRTCAWCGPATCTSPTCPGFLGGALVVAFPSTGEGFGLPVLEAMACGAPGADHAPDVAARGRRRRGGLHRARCRPASAPRCGRCSTTRPAGSRWAMRATPGRWSSPGPRPPRRTWLPTSVRQCRDASNLPAHAESFAVPRFLRPR